MTRSFRILGVTAWLASAGAVTGAICGIVALMPRLLLQWLHPSPYYAFATFSDLAPWAAITGAVLGAVCGPSLAWSLLRHVPLWRVILWASTGTALGSLVGWIAARNPILPGLPMIVGCAFIGMISAGVALRQRAPSLGPSVIATPLPNDR